MTLQELAARIGAQFTGDPGLVLNAVAKIEEAGPGQLSFLANMKYEHHLATTKASAVIVGTDTVVNRDDLAVLRMADPYFGFVLSLRLFHASDMIREPGIHPEAYVHPSAVIGNNVAVCPTACVGPDVVIGDGSVICEGAVLTNGVRVGAGCIIHPNVSVLAGAQIGNNVIVHAGTTIGSDGFGFAQVGGHNEKIPQVGTVIIEDDVEIGANCTIDRGTLGATCIRRGVKLDNLIQVAHNVEIDEHTVMAAQSGVSGSTKIGKNVMVAGQVGFVGHIQIGDRVIVGAQAGVTKSLAGPGKVFRGAPARELRDELRLEAAQRRLPSLIAEVEELRRQVQELKTALNDRG
jgi:UDP-3-O-[3-hydroxymyristoyl] glucosamine N-acyltransferase